MGLGTNSTITDGLLAVPIEQQARQATASLAGHLFQAMRAASEWVRMDSASRLLLEVAEDYAFLARGALQMTQTKHEFSVTVTLRSDGVRKSLASLVAFGKANPGFKVSLVYLTTATPGMEAQSELPNGATGIAYWRDVARGADIAPLRKLLLDTQKDAEILQWVSEVDDDTLRVDLVQRITWLMETPALAQAKAALEAQLRAVGVERTGYGADGEDALPFIVYRILQTAVADDRVLTRDDFESEWQRATSISVSRSALRQMAGIGGAGGIALSDQPPPPELSPRAAPRRDLVDRLREVLRSSDVLWLHGSSGLGKSLLTRLLSARDNGRWDFVSLKDLPAQDQALRVRDAIGGIGRDDFVGLILDDVPVPTPEALRRWISAACLEISAVPTARIVVTSEREPLPQVRSAFEPLRIVVRKAPYLERADVSDVVSAAGGKPEKWADLIYITCGGGHPLLVDARVVGLASKGWPANERLQGLGVGDGPSEIVDVRREVSLRLLDELASDAHLLLLRLSSLIGSFDRQLVDAVAAVAPPLSRAGALLEHLAGPWVEPKRKDRYGVSPLLALAAASLGESERMRIYNAAVDDLIRRDPYPGDLLMPLMGYSMITRHLGGFAFVGQVMMFSDQRAEIASQLFPLPFMQSGADGRLVPEDPKISFLLRTAQVFTVVNIDPPSMVESVCAEALAEADLQDDVRIRYANKFVTLVTILSHESADLSPKVWMPILSIYYGHRLRGLFPQELTEMLAGIDLGGLSAEQMFFAIRSSKVKTVKKVEELFGELDRLDPQWRRELLMAGPILLKGPPLFVQAGWSN